MSLALLFLIIEIITINFFTACLAVGSVIASIGAYFEVGLTMQILMFVVGLILSLLTLRPLFLRFSNKEESKTNIDALVGKEAVVTEKISPRQKGRAKIGGDDWLAVSEERKEIGVGEIVEILKVEGTKLKVTKTE
jgi:membrane protein implicated in regulation of membrane protease activity